LRSAAVPLVLAVNSLLALVGRQLPDVNSRQISVTESDCTHNGRFHEKQWHYLMAPFRWNVVVCSRRAGKSKSAVLKGFRVLTSKPEARVAYVTLIRRNCRKYFYKPLVNLLRAKGILCSTNSQDLTIELDNGSFAQAFGCSTMAEVETVRGDAWDLVIVDEAQSFRDELIRALIDEAIMPSLTDRKGGLDFLGTPPPAGQVGFFWEIFSSGNFEKHSWTLFDNPWIDTSELVEDVKVRGLTPEHAIYKREYLGLFVVDPDSLVFEYQPGRNDLTDDFDPDPEDSAWMFSMGIDLGYSDRDAISVLGWRKDDEKHRIGEAWTWQQNHLHLDQLSEVFLAAVRKWRPVAVVGDNGGHGATKCLKSLEARWGNLEIQSKPSSVADSVALVNDDLRAGKMLWEVNGILAGDAKLTTWVPGKKGIEISSSFHSDALAGMRYAHSCAYHFAGKAKKTAKTQDEIDCENLKKRKKLREAMLHGRAQYR
jgi:hypothetical protein